MGIDTSGKWWTGSEPMDMREYLEAFTADGYPVDEFRLCNCQCGSVDFQLDADDTEGVAKRTCARCNAEHFICDSDEYWEDAEPQPWKCIECSSQVCNVGVGFSQYPDSKTSIKWIYIGVRCSSCGVLGCYADWKVGQDDVADMFDKA